MSLDSKENVPCPHCGNLTGTTIGYCDHCGYDLAYTPVPPVTVADLMKDETAVKTNTTRCPFCSKVVSSTARYCKYCRKKLDLANGGTAETARVKRVPRFVNPATSPETIDPELYAALSERYQLENVIAE